MHDPNICMIGPDMSGLKYIYINERWVLRTKIFNRIARKILQFSSRTFGYYYHFLLAIFGTYSCLLFGFSVIHFLLRIVGYKLGFVRSPKYRKYHPRCCSSGKSYQRGIRYKKNWHRKKRRIKNKRSTIPPLVESSSSAFTNVINVEKGVRTRDLLQYDTDSATTVGMETS